jgi:hypothetical protein
MWPVEALGLPGDGSVSTERNSEQSPVEAVRLDSDRSETAFVTFGILEYCKEGSDNFVVVDVVVVVVVMLLSDETQGAIVVWRQKLLSNGEVLQETTYNTVDKN